jgi:hypothetical protein
MKKRSLMDRLRDKKKQKTGPVVGVSWYLEPDWVHVKAAAMDPDRFENSYSEWETMVNEAVASLRSRLPTVVKVLVTADEFLPWCLVQGKPNNAAARSEYVSEKLNNGTARVAT